MREILKNVMHFIFGKASRSLERTTEPGVCQYCGSDTNWTRYTAFNNVIICDGCKLKAFDKVLGGSNEEEE